MHFRNRGRKIEVLRAGRDDAGKSVKVPIGSIRLPDYTLDDALEAQLGAAERAEVTTYVARQKHAAAVAREHAVMTFPGTIQLVLEWLETADRKEAEGFIDEAYEPLRKLRRQMAALVSPDAT